MNDERVVHLHNGKFSYNTNYEKFQAYEWSWKQSPRKTSIACFLFYVGVSF